MGNSSMSLHSGCNYTDDSLISKESLSTYFRAMNPEEEKMKTIYMRNLIKKQQNEEQKNNYQINNYKIPTMFEWSFKGNSVYLTGSFCNWKEFFLMKKDKNGIFRLVLDLYRGFHQYKFKIDNEWKYNINFPTYNDNGFINNYIDTTNWEIRGEYENEEINNSLFTTSELDLIHFAKEKEINIKISDEFYQATIKYGNFKPIKNELYNIAPQYPYQFIMDCINIDIKNQFNRNNEKKNNINKKDKKVHINKLLLINKFCHEQINHFHLKKIKKNFPLKSSIVSRFRFKFTTFIYYK